RNHASGHANGKEADPARFRGKAVASTMWRYRVKKGGTTGGRAVPPKVVARDVSRDFGEETGRRLSDASHICKGRMLMKS
ncbi:MAG TPA: hypothetical protein VGM32_15760, partial [Rhodopila sp.]